MKRKFIKFLITVVAASSALIFMYVEANAVDPQARAIMEKVDARDDGDNQIWDMEMILVDKGGNERLRKIRAFSKDKDEDTLRLMFFLHPADVKNTAFLTYDYRKEDKDDDQWLYLPALKKTKRIASSDKSSSFMGSDFSYADMTRRELENYDYSLLRETMVGDVDTWLIEAIPRTKKIIDEYGYTKSIVFVRKDNYFVIRGVHWVKEGNRLKYFDVKELDLIDGIWIGTEIHMTTKREKETLHKTIMKNKNVKFNQDLKESFFTVRQMEKGM